MGYTYENNEGTQTDSRIKSILDTWYDVNLESDFGIYITDSIFCNDKTLSSSTYYGAYDRLDLHKNPQLKCNKQEDRYTINARNGNGYLTNPVGLMTADEVSMAGGLKSVVNNTYYLSNSDWWYWTSSPYGFYDSSARVWTVGYGGELNIMTYYNINIVGGVRPVINLKANVQFTGEGTIDNPYEIILN